MKAKKKLLKQIQCIVLCLAMVLSYVPTFSLTASAATTQGIASYTDGTYTFTLLAISSPQHSDIEKKVSRVSGSAPEVTADGKKQISFTIVFKDIISGSVVGPAVGVTQIFEEPICSESCDIDFSIVGKEVMGVHTSYDSFEITFKFKISRSPIAHTGGDATCSQSGNCTYCGTSYYGSCAYVWKQENGRHWQECIYNSSHTMEKGTCAGGTATCDTPAICNVCKLSYGEKNPENHSWSSYGYADNIHTRTCADCGAVETSADHIWSEWESIGRYSHSRKCYGCDKWESQEHFGGTATCVAKKSCTACGGYYDTISLSNHNWGSWVSNGDGTHTRTCSNDASHTTTNKCSGGESTCMTRATCSLCADAYGELGAHSLTYSIKSNTTNTIVEDCSTEDCQHSATSTLSAINQTYTGSALAPASVIYSDDWAGSKPTEINYTNNTNVGTATAKIAVEGKELSTTFQINEATLGNVAVKQIETLVYNGKAQTPTVSTSAVAVNNQPISFTYSSEENGTYGNMPTFVDAGTYTVYYKVSAPNHNDVTGSFIVTVARAENAWAVAPSISGWTYGEIANAPTYEAKFGTVKVTYTGTANDESDYNSETAPIKAGNYTAAFTVVGTKDYSGLSESVNFTIAKATYDISSAKWNYTDAFQYDGKEHKVDVIGLPTGVTISGYEGNTATVVGEYTAKVTLTYDSNNYNAPSVADLNWKIKNNWTPNEYTTSDGGWLNSDFVIAANDGYKVSLTNTADGEWSDTLTGAVEGENSSITFYVKNETTGAISLAKTVSYKLDKNTETTGTTGKVYFDERNGWENFLNTITFGLLYKDEVTVKVEATDKLSGVAKIEYYAADKAMTLEEIEAITTWTAYENGVAVTVEDAKQFVYFVRITDNAGNVTHISTDGAEYDTTDPAISGIENGKTYYTMKKVTVTDKNIESITLNGEAATESITLEGNKEATYTIVAIDKAGNASTVTVTMKLIADVDATIEGITEDDVTSADKETVQDLIDEIDELLKDENLTDDEKAALEEIKDNAEKLIEKLEEVDAADETENTEKVKDVTSENVKPEDKIYMENAKADLKKALEDNGSNYTEDEKKAIESEIKRIDDALDVIENVEAVEGLIDKIPENITKNDETAIKAAEDVYHTLTDYEKSLVDRDAKKALADAKTAFKELNQLNDSTSPKTDDNSKRWIWAMYLFVSGIGVFGITAYTHKRKAINNK